MARVVRSVLVAVVSLLAVTLMTVMSATTSGVVLLTGTMLVMGGNTNGSGWWTEHVLSGCNISDCTNWPGGYVSAQPGTRYGGFDRYVVPWSAVAPFTRSGGVDFDASQLEGMKRFDQALNKYYKPGTPTVAVGISGSAALMSKELRLFQAARDAGLPAPSPVDLSFVLVGGGNRPNGGLFARFPGMVNRGVTFDGARPDTDYDVTDISWQWDPVSDFPNYPLNPFALLNTLIGYYTLHSVYYPADPTDPDTVFQDVTVGHTRYLTLHPDHLPLLKPLQLLGVPKPLIDLWRPPLEYLVELGYNRSISPATPTPARMIPPLHNPIPIIAGFVKAVGKGAHDFAVDLTPKPKPKPKSALPTSRVETSATPVTAETAAEADNVEPQEPTAKKTHRPLVRNSLRATVGETGMNAEAETHESPATGTTSEAEPVVSSQVEDKPIAEPAGDKEPETGERSDAAATE